MSNNLPVGKQKVIIKLSKLGYGIRRIQRETGIHRQTIRKILKEHEKYQVHSGSIPSELGKCTSAQNENNQVSKLSNSEQQRIEAEELKKISNSDIIREKEKENEKITVELFPAGHFENNKCPSGNAIIKTVKDEIITKSSSIIESENVVSSKLPVSSLSKASKHDEYIREELSKGVCAKTIHTNLYYLYNFQGSYDSVKRYVKKIKLKQPKLVGQMISLPGEEAQIDFGLGAPLIDISSGRIIKTYLFKIVLCYSRHSYEEAVLNQKTQTFIQCHINAFNYFGGVPKVCRYDNLKAAIVKCNWWDAYENKLFQSFADHYNFVILACRPKTPQHKGKTEAGVKHSQNLLKGKKFLSLEEQNEYLMWLNNNVLQTRIHGTHKKQVRYMFQTNEEKALQPLPLLPFQMFQYGVRTVHIDSHIQVDNSYYSIPSEYFGKIVDIEWNEKIVRIYYCEKLIKTHKKKSEKGRFITDDGDLPERLNTNQEKYRNYLEATAKKIGENALNWVLFMFNERGVCAYRVIQGVFSLKKNYSLEIIDKACKIAFENKYIRYLVLKELCQKKVQESKQLKLFTEDHEFLRTMSEYAKIVDEI